MIDVINGNFLIDEPKLHSVSIIANLFGWINMIL